jgi:hypothetical protein
VNVVILHVHAEENVCLGQFVVAIEDNFELRFRVAVEIASDHGNFLVIRNGFKVIGDSADVVETG